MTTILSSYPVREMLTDANEQIEAIRTASGLRDSHFQAFCMPLINSFASQVQRLPLSDSAYGSKNGAWEFGLTLAMVAYRYAASQIFFTTAQAEERRILEPQCHFAAFAAGLATSVTLVAQNAVITDKSDGDEFHILTAKTNFHDWLLDAKEPTFKWRKQAQPLTPMESAAVATQFLHMPFFNTFDLRITMMIFGAINPQQSPNGIETTMAKVVRMSTQKILEHHAVTAAKNYSERDVSVTSASSVQDLVTAMIETSSPSVAVNPLETSSSIAPSNVQQSSITRTPSESCENMLSKARPALREWFIALSKHEKYNDLKTTLVVTDQGIEIPSMMLGSFGVQAPTVKSWLDDAGMIVGRTANMRGIILHIATKNLFFGSN